MKTALNDVPKNYRKLFRDVAEEAERSLGQPDNLAVVVTFVTPEQIRSLNKEYRDVDRATDVLSFPTIENEGHGVIDTSLYPYETDPRTGILNLGDIFICGEVAQRQAEEYGHSVKREAAFLFLHGLLHLLGYDHITAQQEEEMTAAAEKILSALDIKR